MRGAGSALCGEGPARYDLPAQGDPLSGRTGSRTSGQAEAQSAGKKLSRAVRKAGPGTDFRCLKSAVLNFLDSQDRIPYSR